MTRGARRDRLRGDGLHGNGVGASALRPIDGTLSSQGPVVIFRWSLAEGWPVEFVTENVDELFGHAAERFLAGEVIYASVIHPDDLAAVSAEVADHLKNGPDTFKHEDYRIVRADGGERWIQDFTVMERDAEGRVHHANGCLVDVTARKAAEAELRRVQDDLEGRVVERTAELLGEIAERRQAEAALERRDAVQRVLNEAMTRLFAAEDWTAIIDGVLRVVGEGVGVDRVHIFENRVTASGERVGSLRFEWTAPGIHGQIGNPLLRELREESTPVKRWTEVLSRGKTLHAVFSELPKAEQRLAGVLDVKAILLVPIFVDDVWWGGIGFIDARTERVWSDTDARALTVLAGALSVAIRRRQDDAALRKSEQRLLGAVESLQEQIALFDAEDRLVLCNEAFRRHNPMAEQAIAEGWSYEDLLRANVQRGFVLDAIGREEAFIRERLIHHRNPTGPILRHLADGTVCLIRENRTPEGGTALTFIDVTDLQNANDAMRAVKTEAETSKILLQDALESTTESFALYDAEGRLVVFNSAYQNLYRHSPELMRPGTSFEEILRERARQGAIPDIPKDQIEEWINWRLQSFLQASGSIERLFPDGTWWKVNEQRTANGGIAQIATDITEIKAREAAMRDSEERFRALFERTAVGAAITGIDFRYHMVNQSFCDMLGYTRDELLTMTPLDVTHPQEFDTSRQVMEALIAGTMDISVAEKRYVRKDGETVWAIVSTTLVRDAAGKPAYTIRHIQDISERKRAEEATRRLRDELAHVSRVRTMGEMATGFAHELNQPLTAIVNYAQGALRRRRSGAIGGDEFVRVMELVAAQAHRAGAVIRRIRRFVQKDEAEIDAVDVNAAIREAVDFIASDAMQHKIEIDLHLADGLPAVKADAVQLQQVILNLARNAIEAIGESSAEGGRLDISTTAAHLPEHVEVLVVDSGPGIGDDVARQAFEPFFTTKPQGMGMGLAICRSIVESSGGRLTLHDPAPGRTTFRILLTTADAEGTPLA